MIADLLPTEEQAAIRDSIAGLSAKIFPVARLHEPAAFGAGAETGAWQSLAELGLFGLGLAEDDGGVGYSIAEEVTAARELGRFLVSPLVLATMLAVHVARGEVQAALRNGTQCAAFANPLRPVDFVAGGLADVQLLDAQGAKFAVLWNDSQCALFSIADHGKIVEAIDETVTLTRATLDLSSPIAVVSGAALARRAGLLLAAYLAGIAEATLEMAVEYAKIRVQFGQPIGAFQAIKHYCADMALRAEAAVSQTFYATIDSVAQGDENLFEMACARLVAANAAVENGRYNVQIHGGMGFTYEADAHMFLKRALLVSAINSGARQEQARIIASAGPA
jgi:alkylation response protein AidB-like acyl-CoA dehydrogenase